MVIATSPPWVTTWNGRAPVIVAPAAGSETSMSA
jgi:hypothetical protein